MARICRGQDAALSVLCLCLLHLTCAFNVDTQNYVLHRGERDSMFGFSVAQHLDRGKSWLLVGAPAARTPQPGVNRGGSVFRCEISRDDSCFEIPFDRKGNNIDQTNSQIDSKSGQWFGATVKSSGTNGIVLVCAPRYVYYSSNKERREPVGTCYVARNSSSSFDEYSPCRTDQWGYHRQGYCQAGFGADISKDGKRLFIGAPGSYYWQGMAFSQSLYTRPDLKATKEGTATDDDSYLGYSVVAGDFTGEGRQGCAVGMPKGASLLGKVLLYTWDLVNTHNVTGTQLGSYFGYSLCATDLDGDGLQDLVVGAPLYTELDNNEGKYETGRVYIFYQGREEKFGKMEIRDGEKSKSRFGLSLAGLGDINKDGFEDFAVGAPYDGPHEHGAVYIYHGSAEGVREKYSQVIFAEEIGPNIATFGFSVSGGFDLDENLYSDLLVGAYESSTAIHFPSRPVVNVDVKLTFSSEVKQIALDDLKCRLRDGTKVACVEVTACFEYGGVTVERRLDFEIQVILDAKKPKSPRMFFVDEEGRNSINQTIRLNNKSLFCRTYQTYIKPNIRDKLSPIEAEVRYSLLKSPTSSNQLLRRAQRSLEPILDMNVGQVQKDTISIQKNCGPDNVCVPDLKMEASPNVGEYLLGSEKRLEFNVEVFNNGEDSFESMFYLTIPPGLNYINIERSGADSSVAVQCSAPSSATNNTLRCDIGNPLPSRKLIKFKVLLQPFWAQGTPSRFDFTLDVNSTNPEESFNYKNNHKTVSIPIMVDTDLQIEGSSLPPQLYYNSSAYQPREFYREEGQLGPQVVHMYAIRNKGPSNILEAEAYFIWPSYTLDGETLLYLLEQPETSGPIKCEIAAKVNEKRVKLEKKKSYLGYADEDESGHGGRLGVSMVEQKESERGSQKPNSYDRSRVSSQNQSSRTETRSGTRTVTTYQSSWSKEYTSEEEYQQHQQQQQQQQRRGGKVRTRRQNDYSGEGSYEDYSGSERDEQKELDDATKCGPTQCTKIKCIVGPFSKDQEVWVALRGRVFADTLRALNHQNLKVSSLLAARIIKLPYIGQPEYMSVKKYEVMTEVISTDTPLHPSEHVPWWVVVLSACVGAAILILLVFLLWKCGFFKRNRPTANTAEKEPLNRNGHYQPGDEPL
ncbi:integrin alpha-PS2 isoform X2 [Neocloeon triangulifer]|uniref:integrin alpha-PS2 isoform X2 n=1 Tax=Neocloeon triangulifer TaxID=2078957 RepID=UPI00286F2BA4|nr:integrin alpha-PS2 isoform X2 [Neocloeon triangulifer]